MLAIAVTANSISPTNPCRENSAAAQGGFEPKSYYRLTTQWQGDGKSLDVVNDGKNNDQLIMANTDNVSGQSWKITKVK